MERNLIVIFTRMEQPLTPRTYFGLPLYKAHKGGTIWPRPLPLLRFILIQQAGNKTNSTIVFGAFTKTGRINYHPVGRTVVIAITAVG